MPKSVPIGTEKKIDRAFELVIRISQIPKLEIVVLLASALALIENLDPNFSSTDFLDSCDENPSRHFN